ncbi:MAG: hypothetical protein ACLQU5_29180 [Isosphaeraceae bacterium]
MSEYVWYYPLDGFGMLAVDLHECRWFHVQSYDAQNGADYGLEFYLTRDGRWIQCKEDEDMIEEKADGPVFGLTQSYREVHPVEVARELLSRERYKGRLCPELEPYREFGDFKRYGEWLQSKWDSDDESEGIGRHTRPKWNPDAKILYFGTVVCLKYAKRAANQFKILDAFESAHWPENIRSPFRDETQLAQTVRDIKAKLPKPSPVRFGYGQNLASWWPASR